MSRAQPRISFPGKRGMVVPSRSHKVPSSPPPKHHGDLTVIHYIHRTITSMPIRDPATPTTPLHVAIVGGGLGGVTAAVVLGKAGLQVDIFEQVGIGCTHQDQLVRSVLILLGVNCLRLSGSSVRRNRCRYQVRNEHSPSPHRHS